MHLRLHGLTPSDGSEAMRTPVESPPAWELSRGAEESRHAPRCHVAPGGARRLSGPGPWRRHLRRGSLHFAARARLRLRRDEGLGPRWGSRARWPWAGGACCSRCARSSLRSVAPDCVFVFAAAGGRLSLLAVLQSSKPGWGMRAWPTYPENDVQCTVAPITRWHVPYRRHAARPTQRAQTCQQAPRVALSATTINPPPGACAPASIAMQRSLPPRQAVRSSGALCEMTGSFSSAAPLQKLMLLFARRSVARRFGAADVDAEKRAGPAGIVLRGARIENTSSVWSK